MAIYKKPTLVMMAGHAGTGKTTFSQLFIAHQALVQRTWAFLDKDTIGGLFTQALMTMHTGNGFDRDSPVFSEKVRPLEYEALTNVVRENLLMGTSCIACAPFGQECKTPEAFEAYTSLFSDIANTVLVWSHIQPVEAHRRIAARAHPMDAYKLENWDAYVQRRYTPDWARNHPKALWFNNDQNEQTTALQWLSQNT